MSLIDVCVATALVGYVAWTIRLKGASARARPPFPDLAWMGAGATLLAGLAFVALRSRPAAIPDEELLKRSDRIEHVERMRSMLAAASEAGDGAVMAATETESRAEADRSRAAIEGVERARADLHRLLESDVRASGREALGRFSESFLQFQEVQREVLALAVKSTNAKARELAFGPAADAVERMEEASTRLVARRSGADDAGEITALALGAELAARRIQVLLPPHIAEARDDNMDEMERQMAAADAEARRDLDALAAIPGLADDVDRGAVASAYASFAEIRTRIVALSRENTNVRSLELSTSSMRAARDRCREALDDLQRSIEEEPIAGVSAAPPFNPRRLREESRGER